MQQFSRHLIRLTCLLLAGCGSGSSLVPVSGSVAVNDKPAVGALIVFYPDGPADMTVTPATATVKEDGTFAMASGAEGGVKPGKYIATVVWPDPNVKITDVQRMMGASPSDAPDLLKGRYATREKSNLRVEIKPGENKLDPFALK